MSELADFLQRNGCKTETAAMEESCEVIISTYNGLEFVVEHEPEDSLVYYADPDNFYSDDYAKIADCLTAFLNLPPICRYTVTIEGSKRLPFTEWCMVGAEYRLRFLANGGGDDIDTIVENLELLGNRKLIDYIDTTMQAMYFEASILRVRYTRIYGLDPGNYDVYRLCHVKTEFELYLECRIQLTRADEYLDSADGVPYQDSVSHYLDLAADYVISTACHRLKFEIPDMSVDHRFKIGRDFQKWYLYYQNHLQSNYTEEQIDEILNLRIQEKDVSDFAPPVLNRQGSFKFRSPNGDLFYEMVCDFSIATVTNAACNVTGFYTCRYGYNQI